MVIGSGAECLLAHQVRTVLVPALAVDRAGARLGQGGGYYDRMLAELARLVAQDRHRSGGVVGPSRGAGPRLVAVVGDEELLPAGSVPVQRHDQPMTAAITPTRFVLLGG